MLKPNTAYWFWNRERRGYIEGETELQEGRAPDQNNCSHVRTDEKGEIVGFKPHGEEFKLP